MATLTAHNLSCDRGGRRIFENLAFSVTPGSYVELRGPNGAGKSSLLRLLAGFDQPASGTLAMDGALHYVGHLDALKPALTVQENLQFWCDYFGTGNMQRGLEAFALAHLAEDPAALLSQGQKRRLALSRLALVERPIWLLDEPTVGLDAASLARLENLMRAQLASGGIILAATHADLAVKPTGTVTLGPAGNRTGGETP